MVNIRKTVYLDYAAATPLHERVFAAMKPYFSQQFYNPSSPYLPAKAVANAINEAKETLGRCIGAKASEIVITAGATESINLGLWGVAQTFTDSHLITTAIEHPAVLEAVKRHDHTIVPVLPTGLIDVTAITSVITDKTVLVSVGYVNNELGTVQPLKDLSAAITAIRQQRLSSGNTRPLYFHSDASQAAGYLNLNVSRLGVDLLTLNAAKCYGPKQTGLLWIKSGIKLKPLIVGGGQENNFRSGTQSAANIVGFATALELVEQKRKTAVQRISQLRDELQRAIVDALPDTVINGYSKKRVPNHLHLAWPGIDAERLLFALDSKGVMVATGSACAANKGTRSHVLEAIGMEPELADGSLRISIGLPTTSDDIAYAAAAIIQAVQKEQSL